MAETTPTPEDEPKGLSTKLLLFIAIGLAVTLIALAVVWFLMSSKNDANISEEATDTAVVESGTETTAENADNNQETVDLPDIPIATSDETATDTSTATEPATPALPISSANAASTPNIATDHLLSEIMDLQKQLAQARADNQTLIKQVQTLSSSNQSQTGSDSTNPARTPVPLSNIVRNDSLPDFTKKARPNAANVELAPKWGNFNNLSAQQGG
jgi:flagellar basal body-associated protein FliL